MPNIYTCGNPGRRTEFTYEGNLDSGIIIKFTSCNINISTVFLKAVIDHFKGREVKGGFSMTSPTPGGFGQWVKSNSRTLNETPLSPRHGSFIAAILKEMGYLQSYTDGNAIILRFNA